MKRYMKRLKKTSVNYIRAETPVPLPSTRTGGTKNHNIPSVAQPLKYHGRATGAPDRQRYLRN